MGKRLVIQGILPSPFVIPRGLLSFSLPIVLVDDSLVLDLSFNELFGDIAIDKSGNFNDGKIHGARRKEGALSFDGVDDYVELPANFMSTPNALSFGLWFKTLSTTSDKMMLSVEGKYVIYLDAGKIRVLTDGTSATSPNSTKTYNDGEWHNVFVSRAGNSANTIVYMDGNQIQSFSEGDIYDIDSLDRISAVGSQFGGGTNFLGVIDEVRIYNRALSAEEIWEHYAQGR